jgi:hypothetical protein
MRPTRVTIGLSMFFVIWAVGLVTSAAWADDDDGMEVKWERIEGAIVPGTVFGGPNVVGGVNSGAVSWTAEEGDAKLNKTTGRLRFEVEGLVLAATPAGNVIGTRGLALQTVKGTIVCNAASGPVILVDTPPVPLSFQGDAEFEGTVGLPAVCADPAFLIRGAMPGTLPFDSWIAHGAVRRP